MRTWLGMTACLLWIPFSPLAPEPASAESIPASIAAEGVPDLPGDLVDQLERYQNSRSASLEGWVGDKREILILTRFGNTSQVHRVAFPGGDRRQLTFLRDRVLGSSPRPHRDQFFYSSDQGGAENFQIFLQDLKSGAVNRLTSGQTRNIAPRWSNSGSLLAYSNNSRNGKDMDIYVADTNEESSPRQLKEVRGHWSVTDWSPDDRRVAAVEMISANESYVHLINVDSGEVETLTPRPAAGAETVAYDDVRWSKDGQALYWTTDLDSEFHRLARYDLASKQATVLTAAIPWDVTAFDLSDDGRMIVVVANEDGISRLHVFDARTHEELPVPALPRGQISNLLFRPNTRQFGFSLASAESPADVYSYDLAGGPLERWTTSETGGLDATEFVEPQLIHYPSFDGRSIPAFVYKPGPKFKAPRPVLINIHGGPEGQFVPGYLGTANYLVNELGIAVIYPNVRGSAGYGKTYLKLDNGEHREEAVKDIGALLDWVGKQPDLDATRVAVTGGSYGGFMCLATMTHYCDRLRAGIDIVGISSFLTFLKNTQSYRRDLRRAEYGDERDPRMKEFLERVSPLTSATKITKPLLVVAGQNDPRVPASESAQMAEAVRQNKVPVWYVVGKNEGHGFSRKENQDYLMAAEVLFLKKYLLGD